MDNMEEYHKEELFQGDNLILRWNKETGEVYIAMDNISEVEVIAFLESFKYNMLEDRREKLRNSNKK